MIRFQRLLSLSSLAAGSATAVLVEDGAVEEAVSLAVLLFLRKGQLRLVSVITGVEAGLGGGQQGFGRRVRHALLRRRGSWVVRGEGAGRGA